MLGTPFIFSRPDVSRKKRGERRREKKRGRGQGFIFGNPTSPFFFPFSFLNRFATRKKRGREGREDHEEKRRRKKRGSTNKPTSIFSPRFERLGKKGKRRGVWGGRETPTNSLPRLARTPGRKRKKKGNGKRNPFGGGEGGGGSFFLFGLMCLEGGGEG